MLLLCLVNIMRSLVAVCMCTGLWPSTEARIMLQGLFPWNNLLSLHPAAVSCQYLYYYGWHFISSIMNTMFLNGLLIYSKSSVLRKPVATSKIAFYRQSVPLALVTAPSTSAISLSTATMDVIQICNWELSSTQFFILWMLTSFKSLNKSLSTVKRHFLD